MACWPSSRLALERLPLLPVSASTRLRRSDAARICAWDILLLEAAQSLRRMRDADLRASGRPGSPRDPDHPDRRRAGYNHERAGNDGDALFKGSGQGRALRALVDRPSAIRCDGGGSLAGGPALYLPGGFTDYLVGRSRTVWPGSVWRPIATAPSLQGQARRDGMCQVYFDPRAARSWRDRSRSHSSSCRITTRSARAGGAASGTGPRCDLSASTEDRTLNNGEHKSWNVYGAGR